MKILKRREPDHFMLDGVENGDTFWIMNEKYDLVVIGAGPAGEKGAAQAAYFGKRVAIVETSPFPGGIAVSSAGIPTKALRESAIYLSGLGPHAQDLPGLSPITSPPSDNPNPGALLSLLMTRKSEVTNLSIQTVRRNLTRHRIELIHGHARLLPGRCVEVTLPEGSQRKLEAQVVLLAPGSRTVRPEWMIEDPMVIDSESVLDIERLPRDLVVVGGGAVGCEYASIFAALGIRVTLLCRADRLLPNLDPELSRTLAESFNGMGIRVVPGSTVTSLIRSGDRIEIELESQKRLTTELVLVAVGRKARIEGLCLKEVGVELGPEGNVKVDTKFHTTLDKVFAAGDVIGPPGLAATSMEQARVAMCHAFDFKFKEMVDPLCPTYVFSIPEIASVGKTEADAKSQGIDVEVGRASFSNNAKARVSGFADGLIKLVFRVSNKQLLGVQIVGELASELVHLGQFVLREQESIDAFIDVTFAVPTRSEAYKYAAYDGMMRLERRSDRTT